MSFTSLAINDINLNKIFSRLTNKNQKRRAQDDLSQAIKERKLQERRLGQILHYLRQKIRGGDMC